MVEENYTLESKITKNQIYHIYDNEHSYCPNVLTKRETAKAIKNLPLNINCTPLNLNYKEGLNNSNKNLNLIISSPGNFEIWPNDFDKIYGIYFLKRTKSTGFCSSLSSLGSDEPGPLRIAAFSPSYNSLGIRRKGRGRDHIYVEIFKYPKVYAEKISKFIQNLKDGKK